MKLYTAKAPTVLTGESIPLVRVRYWTLPESEEQQVATSCVVSTIRVLPILVSTEEA